MLYFYTVILTLISFISSAQTDVVDVKNLLKKSVESSQDFDIGDLRKRSSEFDVGDYNVNGLRDVMGQQYTSKDDVKDVVEGFGDVMGGSGNTDKLSPIQIASGIANLEAAKEREEILNFMGISELKNHLYVFVSYSMSEDMIRAYAREAMWAGASLVVRGLVEGETMADFVHKKAKALLNGKGYTAAMHIDPRLYDAFGVTAVPAIVLSKDDVTKYCQSSDEKIDNRNVTRKCVARDPSTFVKVSGAITLDYALQLFSETDLFEEEATSRLVSLRENVGVTDSNEQADDYKFKDELSPHQKMYLSEHYSQFGEVVDTDTGITVKPFAPPERMGVHMKRHEKKM